MATVAAWLAGQGLSLILGFVAKFMLELWQQYQNDQAKIELGKLQEREKANRIAAEKTDAMGKIAADGMSDGDVADRLRRGSF